MSHFDIWFNPAEYLAHDHDYALRTSVDGWETDLDPADSSPRPHWVLDYDRYAAPFQLKFLIVHNDADRSQDVWMLGPDLRLTPTPDGSYSFAAEQDGPITFPFFVRLVGDRFDGSSITVRDAANGWADRSGWHDGYGWSFAIPWTDYFNSSAHGPVAVRYKFARDGAWMKGPNLKIGPGEPNQPGEYAHAGLYYDTEDGSVFF